MVGAFYTTINNVELHQGRKKTPYSSEKCLLNIDFQLFVEKKRIQRMLYYDLIIKSMMYHANSNEFKANMHSKI